MTRFVSFDGNRTFYSVDQIASVTEAQSYTSLLVPISPAALVTFIDGTSITLQMTPPQAMYLIRTAT